MVSRSTFRALRPLYWDLGKQWAFSARRELDVKTKTAILWLALLGAAAPGAASAHGYGYHGYGHGHYPGPRVGFGIYMGVPFGYPWYAPPNYYYPPTVIVRPAEPQVYIERAAPQTSAPSQPVWYYCSNPQGYYPYVKECPGGWQHVVPAPPPN